MTTPPRQGGRGSERPETGLGDLIRALAALRADPVTLQAIAELLGIALPARSAGEPDEEPVTAVEPTAEPEKATSAPPETDDVRALQVPDDTSALPVTATYFPPGPPPSAVPAPRLDEVLPTGRSPKPPQGLFPPEHTRALLGLITAQRQPQGEIDADRAVSRLARGQPLTRVPRHWINTSRGRLELALDTGPGMEPYRHDVDRLAEQIARITGPDRLSLRWFHDGPAIRATRFDMGVPDSAHCGMPPAGTLIVAVTTFGTRGPVPPAPVVLHRWHEFHAASVREHTPLVVLTPLAPDRLLCPAAPASGRNVGPDHPGAADAEYHPRGQPG